MLQATENKYHKDLTNSVRLNYPFTFSLLFAILTILFYKNINKDIFSYIEKKRQNIVALLQV